MSTQKAIAAAKQRFMEAHEVGDWPLMLCLFNKLAYFILESPGDNDVTAAQRKAWRELCEATEITPTPHATPPPS